MPALFPPRRPADRYELRGTITSAGFSSGDRFVVGHWHASPIGPLADVMWAGPDGRRRLLAGSERAAAFVSAVYEFESVEVVPFRLTAGPRSLDLEAGGLRLTVRAGRAIALPLARPAWFSRRVEGPIARRLLAVEVYGVSPTGVHEWYRPVAYRRVTEARASVDGRDLGTPGPLDPPTRFGFSEPPRRPSMVSVRPLLFDPGGRLRDVIGPQ